MADLNISVIARWVDRMSAGAKGSAASLAGLDKASTGAAKAVEMAAKGSANVGRMAELAAKATFRLTGATMGYTRASHDAAEATDEQTRSLNRNSQAADQAVRRFSALEKAQLRGRAATRLLGGELDGLHKKLMTLAAGQIYAEGLSRTGHAISRPLERAIESGSAFSGGMTGFGITAELSDAQMAPIRRAILRSATAMALTPETALETFAFTRRSGVFRSVPEIIAAGGEATRFQKLAERMGSSVTGEDAAGGAASAVREYGFAAKPDAIRRFFAMIDAAEKTGGGMKMAQLLEYARSSGGQMKALNFGTAAGLADVLAGQQLSNYLAHTGGQAGINFQDMLTQLALPHTLKRYQDRGVDLEQAIKLGVQRGISPIETVAGVTQRMTGGDRFRIGELMANQQATQAMLALLQNMGTFGAYASQIRSAGAVGQYNADVSRVLNDQRTALERLASAQATLGVATGSILLPALTKLATGAQNVATWFARAEESGGPLAKVAVYAASALGVFALGAGAVGHAVLGVVGPVWIMQSLFGKGLPLALIAARGALAGVSTAMWGFAAAAAANPLTWIIGGVAALGVAGYLLVSHWSQVKAWFLGFWEWLTTTVSTVVDKMHHLFEIKPPAWLTAISVAAAVLPGGGALDAAAAAAAASRPSGSFSAGSAGSGTGPRGSKVEQHFHIYGADRMDHRALAREMHRISTEGLNRALHDGGSE